MLVREDPYEFFDEVLAVVTETAEKASAALAANPPE